MAQARHDSVVTFTSIKQASFSRREKVPLGRMRALLGIYNFIIWLLNAVEDPHPTLRATFPQWGKGELTDAAQVSYCLELSHVH